MKNLMRGLCIVAAFSVILAFANQASAVSISFSGAKYSITKVGAGTYLDKLHFDDANVNSFEPGSDTIFNDAGVETVRIADLFIVDLSKTTIGTDDFFAVSPSIHVNGFTVFDDDGITKLIEADLTVSKLKTSGGTGSINSQLDLNLTNITSDILSGLSPIVDAFVYDYTPNGGITTVSLQFTSNISNRITSGTSIINHDYSGSASPVPEPGTVALLGIGLAGLVGTGVRKKMKKQVG